MSKFEDTVARLKSVKIKYPLGLARLRFTAAVRADAWDVIADLMESGLDDNRAIEAAAYMFKLRGQGSASALLLDLSASIGRGEYEPTLAQAARGAEALVFSNAGQVAGPVVFRGAARVVRNEQAITAAIVEALTKPALLIVSIIDLLEMMGLKMFPAFEEISPPSNWPAMTQSIARLSGWLIASGYYGLAGAIASFAAIGLSQAYAIGEGPRARAIRTQLDRFPPWSFYRLRTGAAFAFAVIEIARSGGTLNGTTLRRMAQFGSKYSRIHITAIADALETGGTLATAFKAGGGFPDPELNAVMSVLAGQPNAIVKFGTYTDRWILTAEKAVKRKSATLNGLLLILITGVIAAVIQAIFGIMLSVGTGL